MKRVTRRLRGHFGATAKRVAVRSQQPWYWQWLVAILLVLFGYLAGYWQFTGGDYVGLIKSVNSLLRDNQTLEAKTVYRERQLQVERAAQQSLADELAALQDESMLLKEEVAFYRGILNENSATGELKLHSFKLNKGKVPNQYDYHVLLIQSGRHDKMAEGSMELKLVALKDGEQVFQPLSDGLTAIGPIKINFKYYQRIDGSFTLPADVGAPSVTLSVIERGFKEPKIRQQLDLPT
jgi:hypothetical protein